MKTIALCMIVRDEAQLIRRCLDSARLLLNYVFIVDTGSTNGTADIIYTWLLENNLPGSVAHERWQDFAHNRSLALTQLRGIPGIDYALVLDADDQLMLDPGFDPVAFKEHLSADMYDVEVEQPPIRHWRPHLLSNRLEFRYRGVLHEFVEGPPVHTRAQARGFHVLAGVAGYRSRNPNKYHEDAEIMIAALATETDPLMRSRYTFYIAQSWKDTGQPAAAVKWYLDRANMGGWEGEVYISLLHAAQLMEGMQGILPEQIIGTYLRAHEADPSRVEALNSAVRWCHRTGRFHQGYLIGKHGITMPEPSSGKLFAERWVYDWGMLDNFSVAAYWAGYYQESAEAAEKTLTKAPDEHRQRITDNIRFSREKLGETLPTGIPVKADFTIAAVEIPGYAHSGAYAELAETVLYGLRALGYTVELRHDQNWGTMPGKIIIIGAHLCSRIPAHAIVYNTEHNARVVEPEMVPYFATLQSAETVWDYSAENSRPLAELLGRPVKHVLVGYVPELTRITPAEEQDIDVLFYGSLNERRERVLKELRTAGLNVVHLFGIYGAERDAYIARAKVVLSMHYYEPGVFEALRVSYLLANRKAVLCEDNDAFEGHACGGRYASYGDLTKVCGWLIDLDANRHQLEKDSFNLFTAVTESDILRAALRRRVWDCFLYNGETDVLAIRLHELKDVVDRFVLVESDTTFSGEHKLTGPYPNEILIHFGLPRELANRIAIVRVRDMSHLGDPWGRERHQRDAIARGLYDAAPDDLIMISDIDEIPRASVVREMADDLRHNAFAMKLRFYYFLLNYRCTTGSEAHRVWNCAVTKSVLDRATPDTMRYVLQNEKAPEGAEGRMKIIEDAGWHFSNLADDEGIRGKIRAFSHQELNTPEMLASVNVGEMVARGADLFGRAGYGWTVESTDGLPEWVRGQPEMMEKWTRRVSR